MSKTREYGGIDQFRVVAAILVIAIHTSPFLIWSETADFIFTRVIARVAVPFFFMTSGFFLLGKGSWSEPRWRRYLKKTLLIYAGVILLYLPLNIYTGYFHQDGLFYHIVKDLLFDGTFYHLWYLPASILGAVIAYLLLRKLPMTIVLFLTFVLYILGLMGDSYYGFTGMYAPLRSVYDGIFKIFDYTRNGIFFAPIFFVLGANIAGKAKRPSMKISLAGFAATLVLMMGEGLLLHRYGWQRHDSMYLFLVPCMYFLFCTLIQINTASRSFLRQSSLILYLIHPMIIILIRGIAKLTHTESILIEHSFIHFIMVLSGSALVAGFLIIFTQHYGRTGNRLVFKGEEQSRQSAKRTGSDKTEALKLKRGVDRTGIDRIGVWKTEVGQTEVNKRIIEKLGLGYTEDEKVEKEKLEGRYAEADKTEKEKLEDRITEALKTRMAKTYKKVEKEKTGRAWLEINRLNLQHNVLELMKIMPKNCELMGIVKANAYGHGAKEIAESLAEMGIGTFGVATIDEGIALRKQGIKGDILILGYTDIQRARQLVRYRLTQTLIDYEYAIRLNSHANKPIQVHIKIDSGMNRVGIMAREPEKVTQIFRLKNLQISGIFTHLCCSDSLRREDIRYTEEQISTFYSLLSALEDRGITLPKIHIQSSYGLLNYPELRCDYARIGIALYGTLSTLDSGTRVRPNLLPVLSLKARVALIKEIKRGESVSYGRTFTALRDSRMALLPIGYADGLPRTLSCENGRVLIHGQQAPIVGRICMDQLLVDITDLPEVIPGDIATLIGPDGRDEIMAEEVAMNAGTITNELFSRLGSRLERVYLS